MNYLVDTDWVIDYLKGEDRAIQLLDPLVPEGMAVSLITYGEIYEGIYYSRTPAQHEQIFQAFLHAVTVLPLTERAMEKFARIRGDLRSRGQIIGDLDILIAATALDLNLTLITQNVRHFNRIEALELYAPS
jgi:tRNA(fMet)-specific endonuclease VapC